MHSSTDSTHSITLSSLALTTAPFVNSNLQQSALPPAAAQCIGVTSVLSFASTSAPRSSK
eukprot:21312-Heterococcus_DN1.PRE.1